MGFAEGAGEAGLRGKAGGEGDVLHRQGGIEREAMGLGQAQGEVGGFGALAEGGFEAQFQQARGERELCGQRGDAQGRLDMGLHQREGAGDGGVMAGEALAAGGILRQLGGLGGIMQESACDLLGQTRAEAFLDQAQDHIEAGQGGAGGGEFAGLHKAVGQGFDRLKAGGEALQIFPMGCGALAVEQAGAGQKPACAVNRGNLACARREAAQGRKEPRRGMGVEIEPRHHDQQIAAFQRGERYPLHLYARGEPGGGLVRGYKAPGKQRPPGPAVGGAQWVNGGGKAEGVAVAEHEHRCVECF